MFKFHDCFRSLPGQTVSLKILSMNPGDDELIPFYWYDIVLNTTGEVVGKISIRIGDNYHSYYNGHIGYEIDEPYRGHGYALAACKMVLPVARFHGMTRLHLTCDEDNIASYKTIEKLGGKLMEIVTPPQDYFAWFDGIAPHRIYELKL